MTTRSLLVPIASVIAGAVLACGESNSGSTDAGTDGSSNVIVEGDYTWVLPAGFPKPAVPTDNPISTAKVELGRRLFYDTKLSGNRTQSCASCHEPARAFTDAKANAVGSTGEVHPRSSMSLANIGYATAFTWANDLFPSLEKQTLAPMFGETPVELGLAGKDAELLARLTNDALYPALFSKAFPGDGAITLDHIVKAIASFERTLLSGSSRYDRYASGADKNALSEAEIRGKNLFFSERLECFHCHGGFAFSDSVASAKSRIREQFFHNTGLYNIDGKGAYPPQNTGLFAVSGKPEDMGRFKAPTLRNIDRTAPYMHDGSIATLEEVVDHYAAGGRTITSGPNAGNGSENPFKDPLVRGFAITSEERSDLVQFLKSLTDEGFLADPRLAPP